MHQVLDEVTQQSKSLEVLASQLKEVKSQFTEWTRHQAESEAESESRQLLQVDDGYVAEGASRRTPVPAGTARLMAAVTASLGQARRAEAGRDVVVEFDESVASCEGADGAMVDGSLIVLLMLLLAAAIFGVLLGYCVRAALDPATTVARRTPQTRRTVATQSMVTYRREWATPRFTVLPDDLQGTFGEQIG